MANLMMVFSALVVATGLSAQETKPFFVHLGAGKLDAAAESFTAVGEAGVPILKNLDAFLGVFAGASAWSRGAYVPSSVTAGSLLQKKAYWGGAYWGGRIWSLGLAAEFGVRETYTPPVYSNDWYTGVTRNQAGAGGFVSIRMAKGFGAFLRAGTLSGAGAGLSLNF